ncbi:MAG: hypothetical protein WA063_00730 [Minisyncoccia bacterium]
MISSKIKNNIYALISLSTIIITVISFVFITSFLVKMNNSIFNVDSELVKEKNTVLNVSGYEKIRDKIKAVSKSSTNISH